MGNVKKGRAGGQGKPEKDDRIESNIIGSAGQPR